MNLSNLKGLKTEREIHLQKLYSHIVKRLSDEFGIEIDSEWEQRVIRGDHDVPLPSTEDNIPVLKICDDGIYRIPV